MSYHKSEGMVSKMNKGWRIAVILILVLAVTGAVSLKTKDRNDRSKIKDEVRMDSSVSSEAESPVSPQKAEPKESKPQSATRNDTAKPDEQAPRVSTHAKPSVNKGMPVKPRKSPATATTRKSPEPASGKPVPAKSVAEPRSADKKVLPKLLDLGASKCVPCKMMAPILEKLAAEYKGKLVVQFIDVWENRAEAGKYGVTSIPTQVFYDASGKEFFRHMGFFSKDDILAKFKEHGVELSK